ncbi:hypothetical protein NMG60_11020898 [Bertholletia excelsa]
MWAQTQIYKECRKAYRLDQSGELHVPPKDTEYFCRGPCLPETKEMLNCLDKFFSSFIFFNKATTKIIKDTMNSGCSYSIYRGHFDVGEYMDKETSNSILLAKPFRLNTLVLMSGCILFLL